MTCALRWAAMRAILMFHNCEGHSPRTMSTDHNIWREGRAEADSNRGPSPYQPNALPPGQAYSLCATRLCRLIGLPLLSLLPCFFHRRATLLSHLKSPKAASGTCAVPIATGRNWPRMRRRSIPVVPDDTCTSSVVVVVVIEWDRERKPTASKGYYLAFIPVKESYRQFILFTTIDNPTTATSSAADLCSSMRMEIFFSLSLCHLWGFQNLWQQS